MRKYLFAATGFLLLIAVACTNLFSSCLSELRIKGDLENYTIQDSISFISISIVGDLMSHQTQINNAMLPDSTWDYRPSYAEVKPYLSAADFTIGNLETTCYGSGKPYMGYPVFNSPDAFVEAIADAGFDMLVMANNHSMDTGEKGLLRTIDVVEQNGLHRSGTYKSQADRDAITIYDVKGIKLAVLSYTYGVNGNLPSNSYMLNVIDSAHINNDIKQHRIQGAEIVLVYLHYGAENARDPGKDQTETVEMVRLAGADIIIGTHTHVVSPVDYFKTTNGATLDTGIVAYSTGNFLSNQYWRYTDAGLILNINLSVNYCGKKPVISIEKPSYMPTWVYRGQNRSVLKQHVILPAAWGTTDTLERPYLTPELEAKMKEAYDDTREIVCRYTKNIVVQKP